MHTQFWSRAFIITLRLVWLALDETSIFTTLVSRKLALPLLKTFPNWCHFVKSKFIQEFFFSEMKWTIAYSRVTWFWLLLDSSSFYRSRDLLSFFHFCSMQSPICIKCTMHTQRKYWIVAEYRCPYGSVFFLPLKCPASPSLIFPHTTALCHFLLLRGEKKPFIESSWETAQADIIIQNKNWTHIFWWISKNF